MKSQRQIMCADAAQALADLPQWLAEERAARRLRLRDVAEACSCSASTLCRLEAGESPSLGVAYEVLRWLAGA